ncbi:hypothetical protein Gorai_007878 [Gossypium raimondii]|uniref:DUF4283 domain-containing protein n=1 Tax=Gossypium raimondii TaxID=29730 RepID=A0A7J8Q958_GOSRA|nr:hypothetical protein [Gossypium raimondii]
MLSTLAFVGDVNIVGSNNGIGRATKRVRRRPKIPLDTDDPMVDENGRKVQSLSESKASYKSKLLENSSRSFEVDKMDEDFHLQQGDETTEIVEGVPSITFPDRVSSMWSLRNPFQVMDLENDYYLVRFQYEEDYNKVLIRRSSWGDLWCLVRAIGQNIRTVTKIDEHANGVRRERFACLAVSVDLKKPLVPKFKINGRIQRVEYDSLLNFYFKCGLYGHNTDWCMANNEPLSDSQANWGVHTNIVEGLQKRVGKKAFGPWMLIERWHRGKGWSMGLVKIVTYGTTIGRSRFRALEEDHPEDTIDNCGSIVGEK